jgi:hypothetical protein
MAKEPKLPKLLAEVRKNRERVAKAAKKPPRRVPAVDPGTANITATVVTPTVAQPPNNYIAEALDECTTLEHCTELLALAKQAGYAEAEYHDNGRVKSGQTIALIRAKIAGLKGGTHHAKLSKETLHGVAFPEYAAAKRGGAR